jgi:hypothetical protein
MHPPIDIYQLPIDVYRLIASFMTFREHVTFALLSRTLRDVIRRLMDERKTTLDVSRFMSMLRLCQCSIPAIPVSYKAVMPPLFGMARNSEFRCIGGIRCTITHLTERCHIIEYPCPLCVRHLVTYNSKTKDVLGILTTIRPDREHCVDINWLDGGDVAHVIMYDYDVRGNKHPVNDRFEESMMQAYRLIKIRPSQIKRYVKKYLFRKQPKKHKF